MIGIMSLIFGFLLSGIGLIYGIFLFRRHKMFRNYTFESFRPNFQSKFCFGTILLSLIVSAVLVLCINFYFTFVFCIVAFSLIFTFILVKKPYLGWGNIRSSGNICILLVIWIILIIYRLSDNEFRHKGLGIYIPLIILICLILCLCLNIPLMIYYIVHNIKNG